MRVNAKRASVFLNGRPNLKPYWLRIGKFETGKVAETGRNNITIIVADIYRDWINNNTSVIVKHHLLDSTSPGRGASPESWHLSRHTYNYNTSHPKRIEEHSQRVHLSRDYIH